jgi:hypothetical protein
LPEVRLERRAQANRRLEAIAGVGTGQ